MPAAKSSYLLGFLSLLMLALTSLASAAEHFKVLHVFNPNQGDGGYPAGSLVLDSSGDLYGTTNLGGSQGGGTVYELIPSASHWTAHVIHNFGGSEGASPYGSITFDSSGNIYGTAGIGGAAGYGSVYELKKHSKSWETIVLHGFCGYQCGDGSLPLDGPVFDNRGNLYGTTAGGLGNGIVYRLTPAKNGWTEDILHNFCQPTCDQGAIPGGKPLFDRAGNIHGETQWTNLNGSGGTAFELTRQKDGSWEHQVIHTFPASKNDGQEPVSATLISDASGALYGATAWGGDPACIDGCGIVYKLTPGHDGVWHETIIHAFHNDKRGTNPDGGLSFDKNGNLYGVTEGGGNYPSQCASYGCGVVFKLTSTKSGSWTYSILHAFSFTDGAYPAEGLVFDSQGDLFGITSEGGNLVPDAGVVFEITP
jgi:uncharacterized repeat protein (TIGR03803 family)